MYLQWTLYLPVEILWALSVFGSQGADKRAHNEGNWSNMAWKEIDWKLKSTVQPNISPVHTSLP